MARTKTNTQNDKKHVKNQDATNIKYDINSYLMLIDPISYLYNFDNLEIICIAK